MGKLSTIAGPGALLLAAVSYMASGSDNDNFIHHWDVYGCEQATDGATKKEGICVDTYGREIIVHALSAATREKLIKIEREFLDTRDLSSDLRQARDALVGEKKSIFWHVTQNCPAEACFGFCYSTEKDGCKAILANKGIRIK